MLYSRSSYSSLPSKAGVYVFLGAPTKFPLLSGEGQGEVLYVGKAKDLKSRVSSYFVNSSLLGDKTKLLVARIEKIRITIVESELEALLLEAFYIKQYKPKYNIRLMDNKSYLRIRVTIKDKYPKILLARQEDDPKSVYFGPFPNAGAVRLVLKTIRKIFPYQSVANHPKRICLYNHLGLCPCPPVFGSHKLEIAYKKNIRRIIKIFEGESKKVMKELEKERDRLSKEEKYEEALIVQRKVKAFSLITTPFRRPFEYDTNPNLRSDIRAQELEQLREVLNQQISQQKSPQPPLRKGGEHESIPLYLKGSPQAGDLIPHLSRIECYDISNTQGTNATGSMVVLTNGEIDKSQYRRFKIRRENTPNDFAMMKEVLTRRFKHDGWETPDLIIVDGGKGQVSSALEVLTQLAIKIPLIGLAKREETIIVPIKSPQPPLRKGGERENTPLFKGVARRAGDLKFLEISLPKNSPALHLIMRIRDEAHRFAITYHRKLRSKAAY